MGVGDFNVLSARIRSAGPLFCWATKGKVSRSVMTPVHATAETTSCLQSGYQKVDVSFQK